MLGEREIEGDRESEREREREREEASINPKWPLAHNSHSSAVFNTQRTVHRESWDAKSLLPSL